MYEIEICLQLKCLPSLNIQYLSYQKPLPAIKTNRLRLAFVAGFDEELQGIWNYEQTSPHCLV